MNESDDDMLTPLLAEPALRTWENHVRPADWVNPRPAGRYHLAVLGGGPAGLVSAAIAAGLGAKVALVEKGRLGGDCLNFGCVPSKALLSAAIRHRPSPEDEKNRDAFRESMLRLRETRARLAENDSAARFRSLGVDVYLGAGSFTGPRGLTVGGRDLSFRVAVIASGARAALPPIPGLADAQPLTNETVFELSERPASLVVLGAGPIGCELAFAFARFGARVTLVEVADRILVRDDADAAAVVRESLEEAGIRIVTGAKVTEARGGADGARLTLTTSSGGETIAAERLLVGAGRLPNVTGIGLEAAGVAFDERGGIRVDEYLRTSAAGIYAAGDVASMFRFTHAADAAARVAVRNALFPGKARFSTGSIPWCTFTDPELAQVGLTEEEAARTGVPVDPYRRDFREVDRAALDDDARGFVKILTEKGGDRIVGATAVGRGAGELIGYAARAMAEGRGLSTLSSAVYPYPSRSEIFRHLGDARARRRFTPFARRMADFWFRLTV